MNLDNNCVRDILLYVKINSIFEKNVEIDSIVNDLYKYNKDMIFKHILELDSKNMFKGLVYIHKKPNRIHDLSFTGCKYLKLLL